MPSTVNVTLDCRNFASGANSGYTNVTGSNNRPYSYKYTGGTDGSGNVTVRKGQPIDVTVTIQADPRYDVNGTAVSNDPHNDISQSKNGKTATFADNARDVELDIYYSVKVIDTTANATFVADPKIDNINQ